MANSDLKLKVKSSGQFLNIFQVTDIEGQYACQGVQDTTPNFIWTIAEALNNPGWSLLKVKNSGQYLNVLNSASNNGATAGQNTLADPNNPPANFLWKLTNAPKNPGWCFLQVKSSGQYLNILNAAQNNGAVACQGVANSTDNFLWQINYVGETIETHTITVSATVATPKPPTLSDEKGNVSNTEEGDLNFTTPVGPGDVIMWQKDGNISSLDNVFETGGKDIFIIDPSKENNGTWVGIVGSMDSGAEEEYSITYKVGGNTFTQDPKIAMNPRNR